MKAALLVLGLFAGATAARLLRSDCSGNGFFYADVGECSCFSCFSGAECDTFDKTCGVDDLGGNPLLHEQYWRANPLPVQDTLGYRVSYQNDVTAVQGVRPTQGSLMPYLNRTISNFHAQVGNVADLEKKSIVVGAGCTQLINAAVHACKKEFGTGRKMYVFANAPYYSGYPTAGVFGLHPEGLEFTGRTDLAPEDVIEFVTYPNNPTNGPREPVYGGRAACTIYDSVYLWPSLWKNFTLPSVKPDIQLFSLSKLSGHAGTRFGWGFTENTKLVAHMAEDISAQTLGLSIDAQLKAYAVFNHLNEDGGKGFFDWVQGHLVSRWARIDAVFDKPGQARFTQLAERHGFYAWVRCNVPAEAANCARVFADAGIRAEPGPAFGATPAEVRLEMVQSDVVFDIIVERLNTLV